MQIKRKNKFIYQYYKKNSVELNKSLKCPLTKGCGLQADEWQQNFVPDWKRLNNRLAKLMKKKTKEQK